MTTPVFNLPNLITIFRMALSPFLVLAIVAQRFGWALVLFVVAGLTDALDGLIARYGRQKTDLGAMLDPVADKLLLGSAFVALTWTSALVVAIPAWLTVISLSRDIMIIMSVAVVNLAVGRRVFYPTSLGKASTASQIFTVGLVIVLNWLQRTSPLTQYAFMLTVGLIIGSSAHYVFLATNRKDAETQKRRNSRRSEP
jgi:cardiolipin synthase